MDKERLIYNIQACADMSSAEYENTHLYNNINVLERTFEW